MTLAQTLARRRASGRCGFVPFVESGDGATERLVAELARAGADIVELGVPFSDPVADGPAIQAASERALRRGASLARTLSLAARLRRRGAPPLVLFTYLNPVLRLGREPFAKACAAAGVAGVLIVDLPAEEWKPWKRALEARGVEPVLLASPTTSDERLRLVGRMSGSLVYYVSREGVTGVRQGVAPSIAARLRRVEKLTGKPLIVGFGVARREQAKALAPRCAGVVVGSAIVAAAANGGPARAVKVARDVLSGLGL